jgi:hypothetical protein
MAEDSLTKLNQAFARLDGELTHILEALSALRTRSRLSVRKVFPVVGPGIVVRRR